MATLSQYMPSGVARATRRAQNTWRIFFAPGDFTALLAVIGLLLTPILALERAGWPLDVDTAIPAMLLSVLFGFMLARSHYNDLFGLILSGIYGACFVGLIAAINEPGGLGEGAYSVFSRSVQWGVDLVTGGINQDPLIFTLLVSALVWFLSYNAVWHTFRVVQVWRAVVPPGFVLLANIAYYDGDANLEWYAVAFVFLALLLMVRSTLDRREWDWYVSGIRMPGRLRHQFLRAGAVLAVVALLFAWNVPSRDLQNRLDTFQEFLQSDPMQQLSELWNRMFTTVESDGPATADYYGGDSLELGGAIRLGDQTVMLVDAPNDRRYYWRSRVFDTYDNGRWTPAADTRLTDPDMPLQVQNPSSTMLGREVVSQEFTVALSATRLIYTAPQPFEVDLPTRTDLRYLPDQTMNISVVRPLRVLYRGDTYDAKSLMTIATAPELRAAGQAYPDWVTDLYLYVSPSVTPRTRQLAQDIVVTAGATTPYDQAKAIESWLRTNITYNETIPQPPPGQDPVDWVLFDYREGYCNYYASAMVVMLRSLGIPARMAAGFAQGTYDSTERAYVVKERDAHTWVEVFFPGYGWIEFEPTAAQAPLNRVGDAQPAPQPSSTPLASPSPTITPSPTATNTPELPTELAQNAADDNQVATPTPTPSPTPTATPVIVPTQPPPLEPPQSQSLLSFLLPALGLVLLGILSIVLLLAVLTFIYWWWEWRGMRGLSPISRAYARLERYLGLIGISLPEQHTPEERRQRIIRDLPAAEPPVSAITRMYTVERYGPANRQRPTEQVEEFADEMWTETRSNILTRYLRGFVPWLRAKDRRQNQPEKKHKRRSE